MTTFDNDRAVYSVTQLNTEVKFLLEQGLPLLWIEGEISNLSQPASGHIYFSLKDARSQVRCAMFRNKVNLLRHKPGSGDQVLVRAKVSLYAPRGDYQLIVEHMEPAGLGALQRAYEALRAKLDGEGLFSQAHKKPLPSWPRRVGVITSPTGAAIRDVLSVLKRRMPTLDVVIYPSSVQGEAAAGELRAALARAVERNEVDVLLITRGGGSLEDLWSFNDEALARAIYACPIPIVSAVGHEVDFTIADFVADLRAPTPSAAAETVSPDGGAILEQARRQQQRLAASLQRTLGQLRQRHSTARQRLHAQHPERQLQEKAQRLDDLLRRLSGAQRRLLTSRHQTQRQLQERLGRQHPARQLNLAHTRLTEHSRALRQAWTAAQQRRAQALQGVAKQLDIVSPLATLGRGYAIAQLPDGEVVTNAARLTKGDDISVRLAKGRVDAVVKQSHGGGDKAKE